MEKLKVLDLFSGLGAFSLGLERAGMATAAFVEIDPYCCAVLAKHWPSVPVHEDVTTRDFKQGEADVITGGFPCQDVSYAGPRTGVSGARSGLYREVVRAIRLVRPRFTLLENVAALLGNGMGRVLGDVAEDGLDAEWDCVSVGELGAPHGRDRVWIAIADTNQFQWSHGRCKGLGWWLWKPEEVEAARNADGLWKLQPPRLLGDIRRRIDNATGPGAWWSCDWKAKFEAFRRMDDGAAHGSFDRSDEASAIKALGNTLCPFIAELWGRSILSCIQEKEY